MTTFFSPTKLMTSFVNTHPA